jgi:dienelactone hydrolase
MFIQIYQVTGPIERLCRVIASEGYIVASCESYHEFVTGPLVYNDADTNIGNDLKIKKELAAYDSDARALCSYLVSRADCTGNIGSLGMCLGGHLSFRAAFLPEVKASVCLFPTDIHKSSLGKPGYDPEIDSLNRLKEIKGEMLIIFGRQDNHVPLEGRRKIKESLEEHNVNFSYCEFNTAHAFIRDELSKGRYDPSITRICHSMAFELFHRRLHLLCDDGSDAPVSKAC